MLKDLLGAEYDEAEPPTAVRLLRQVVAKLEGSHIGIHANEAGTLAGIEDDVWKAVDGDLDESSLQDNLVEALWLAQHLYSDAVTQRSGLAVSLCASSRFGLTVGAARCQVPTCNMAKRGPTKSGILRGCWSAKRLACWVWRRSN